MKSILIVFVFVFFTFLSFLCAAAWMPAEVFAKILTENNVSSSANTNGNAVSKGGAVVTGNASASASVKTETKGSTGTTMIEATASAGGKTETVKKEISGSVSVEAHAAMSDGVGADESATTTIDVDTGVSGDVKADISIVENVDDVSAVEFKNMKISHAASKENISLSGAFGNIIAALKKSFAYVLSFFL